MNYLLVLLIIIVLIIVYIIVRRKQNADAEELLKKIKMLPEADTKFKCPACGSKQLQAGTRGWHWKTGLYGSGEIIITCENCGEKWRPVFK